ncbi:hypothetical protein ACH5RR_005130 [Cinchona calisaya]|uniref:Non-haem dioxygenase N-terminal domain-containing protein n=1 Tax=Cinchona calisaya TaxID=153742 RepID=A0ABD3AKC4_9GENT
MEDDSLPSPIPTGKGIRSAADAGSTFSKHIDKSKQSVPELLLPQHLLRPILGAELDYRSLLSGEKDSVNRLLRSAAQFGFFQITTGHGISGEEFKSTLVEYDCVFKQLTRGCYYDELVWCPSDKSLAEMAKTIFVSQQDFQTFSEKMDNIAYKLEAVAQEVGKIMAAGATYKEVENRLVQTSNESVLVVVHRYPRHQTEIVVDQTSTATRERGQETSHKHASLCLHFMVEPAEIFLQSQQLGRSFRTNLDTIIVAIGKEYFQDARVPSRLKLKWMPDFLQSGPLFSIELKYWSSSPRLINSDVSHSTRKLFSLADQISILLIVGFLYNICIFLLS